MRASRAWTLIASLVGLGCRGLTDVPSPKETPAAPFSATVYGANWSFSTVTASRFEVDGIELTAINGNVGWPLKVVLRIANVTGPGVHSLSADGDGSSLFLVGTSWDHEFTWSSLVLAGGGSVSVTSVSANRIAGFFSGTADSSGGSGEVMDVRNARFDVTF
jgi:hypothetical protein